MNITFDNLSLYTHLTADSNQDNQKLADLKNQMLSAVPDASQEEITAATDKAIQDARTANPDSPLNMEEIFETAVRQLNPGCENEAITRIRNAWQDFTGVNNLSQDDIGQILVSPFGFVASDENTSLATIQNTMAILFLLMIEIAGEESANQLLEGSIQAEKIMEIAKNKKNKLIEKAIVTAVTGFISAAVQGIASTASMACSIKGLSDTNKGIKASNAADALAKDSGPELEVNTLTKLGDSYFSKASASGSMGQAISGLGQAGGGAVNAIGGLWAGIIDGEIAVLDGESQVVNINKDTADKMKKKAEELIMAMMNILKTIAQARHDTLSNIKV